MTVTELSGSSAPAAGPIITEPGIYDITNEQYHADPVPGGSLSSTGARKLLAPSCPALFRHEQLNGQKPRRTFDFGSAAHQVVLGAGPDLMVVDAGDWRTKAAREARDEAYAAGLVPLLTAEFEQVQQMAAAIRKHPAASALLKPGSGKAEQSLFWTDAETGVWRRARLDWMPYAAGRRLIVPDYKSAVCAAPSAIEKSVHAYGYHQQAAWYLDGVKALGGGDAAFVFIVQEKTAPFLVTVVQLDETAIEVGRRRNTRAMELYRQCVAEDRWPGYSDSLETLSLPSWAVQQELS